MCINYVWVITRFSTIRSYFVTTNIWLCFILSNAVPVGCNCSTKLKQIKLSSLAWCMFVVHSFLCQSMKESERKRHSNWVLCNGCNEFVASENLAENKAAGVTHDAFNARVNSEVLIKLWKQAFLVTHKWACDKGALENFELSFFVFNDSV